MNAMTEMIRLIRAIRGAIRGSDPCGGNPSQYAYEKLRCRCVDCRRIHTDRCMRLRRKKARIAAKANAEGRCAHPQHTRSTAYQYGCRCPECRAENTRRCRESKNRKRKEPNG